MPLVQTVLKTKIEQAFKDLLDDKSKDPSGKVNQSAADKLSSAYDDYASQALAGALTPTGLKPIKATLMGLMVGQQLHDGFDKGLLAYWGPVMWAGPGFIPLNPTIPAGLAGVGNDLKSAFKDLADGKASVSDAADKIAQILHKYTGKLKVTATTVPPTSAVSTIPVT